MPDSTPDYALVIPARFASSRFPGKPLALLNGRPLLLHVVDRARAARAARVVVATDDTRIESLCRQSGVAVQMTAADHPSGTDRIAEVAERLAWDDELIVVGLQGDEPATPPAHLDRLARNLARMTDADMATLCMAARTEEEYRNVNRVKVVRDGRGMALYFSRAAIPHRRASDATAKSGRSWPQAMIHIGLYAYRRAFLRRYSMLDVPPIEVEESLEQLRVLYHGGRIHVDEVAYSEAHGVDHPDDVAQVEQVLKARFDVSARPPNSRNSS